MPLNILTNAEPGAEIKIGVIAEDIGEINRVVFNLESTQP